MTSHRIIWTIDYLRERSGNILIFLQQQGMVIIDRVMEIDDIYMAQ